MPRRKTAISLPASKAARATLDEAVRRALIEIDAIPGDKNIASGVATALVDRVIPVRDQGHSPSHTRLNNLLFYQ